MRFPKASLPAAALFIVALASAAMADIISVPQFSLPGGERSTTQQTTITCATSGVTIRYTRDGSDPTQTSPIYTAPLPVNRSMTLKARAYAANGSSSDVAAVNYYMFRYVMTSPGSLYFGNPLGTSQNVDRSQYIYLQTDVGSTCLIRGVAFNVYQVPGQTMTNCRFRLKHTSKAAFLTPAWETDWESDTLLPSWAIYGTGWNGAAFATPFCYDGVSNLMLDVSFENSNHAATNGKVDFQSTSGVRNLSLITSLYTSPTTWSGTTPSGGTLSANVPRIRLDVQYPTALPKLVSDLNGDGHDDLAGLSGSGAIWYSTNLTTWTKAPGILSSLAFGDLNVDGATDIVGLGGDGSIWYTTNKNSWIRIPGALSKLCLGDLNDDGTPDLIGLGTDKSIWYTMDKATWNRIPGYLESIAAGDLNGDGECDVAGLDASGNIWYTLDLAHWTRIPGGLASIVLGDLNGDGTADIAGLGNDGSIWYTTNRSTWTRVPGGLSKLYVADVNGDGSDDLIGLGGDNSIWYTTNRSAWTRIPGTLPSLALGDLNGDGGADIAGVDAGGNVWYTTDKIHWTSSSRGLTKLYSAR